MKKIKILSLGVLTFFLCTIGSARAEDVLQTSDFVGITFWIISLGMLATTIFLFVERGSVATMWKIPVTVAGVITGVAFVHYMYIRGVWIQTSDTPIVYRYIDWFITIPLQTVEFYLILRVIKKIPSIIFWRLLIAALVMLIGEYLGEAGYILPFIGFLIGIMGWVYILFEIFAGDAAKVSERVINKDLKKAFNQMRMIVAIGWSIYPLGYIFGFPMMGIIDDNTLNVIYNLSDFVNRILFVLIIWFVAAKNTPGFRL